MYTKVIAFALTIAFVQSAVTKDDFGMRSIMRVYEDCQKSDGTLPCLKRKAILFFDRAARMDNIPLIDGVEVKKAYDPEGHISSEKDIEASLPRNLQDKDAALSDMLWEKVAAFANSRTIQLSLPKLTGQDLNKSVEEGEKSIIPIYLLLFYFYLVFYIICIHV